MMVSLAHRWLRGCMTQQLGGGAGGGKMEKGAGCATSVRSFLPEAFCSLWHAACAVWWSVFVVCFFHVRFRRFGDFPSPRASVRGISTALVETVLSRISTERTPSLRHYFFVVRSSMEFLLPSFVLSPLSVSSSTGVFHLGFHGANSYGCSPWLVVSASASYSTSACMCGSHHRRTRRKIRMKCCLVAPARF